jgi:hypothetical protein
MSIFKFSRSTAVVKSVCPTSPVLRWHRDLVRTPAYAGVATQAADVRDGSAATIGEARPWVAAVAAPAGNARSLSLIFKVLAALVLDFCCWCGVSA